MIHNRVRSSGAVVDEGSPLIIPVVEWVEESDLVDWSNGCLARDICMLADREAIGADVSGS